MLALILFALAAAPADDAELRAVPAAAPADDAAIRAVRAGTNAAIAAHDAARLAPAFMADVVIVAGGGDAVIGRPAMLARFAAAFADPDFVTYVRTPARIEIASYGVRAAEHGSWVGRWRGPRGETRMTGTYLAHWVRPGGHWRIRAETYVTLACEGPGCAR
jgi:ketosteroid isomerase-like protein